MSIGGRREGFMLVKWVLTKDTHITKLIFNAITEWNKKKVIRPREISLMVLYFPLVVRTALYVHSQLKIYFEKIKIKRNPHVIKEMRGWCRMGWTKERKSNPMSIIFNLWSYFLKLAAIFLWQLPDKNVNNANLSECVSLQFAWRRHRNFACWY